MKRFNEMTDEELVALSSEDKQKLIDLEFAHAGVIPVDCPKEVDLKRVDITPTETAYECHGILFKNVEDAQKFQTMEKFDSSYDYHISHDHYYLTEKSTYDSSVKEKKFYKKSDIANVSEQLTNNKRLKTIYDRDKAEYDKFVSSTKEIRNDVYSAISDASDRLYELSRAKALFEKHLQLADSNRLIAEKFFRDAYKSNQEIIDKMFPSGKEDKEAN